MYCLFWSLYWHQNEPYYRDLIEHSCWYAAEVLLGRSLSYCSASILFLVVNLYNNSSKACSSTKWTLCRATLSSYSCQVNLSSLVLRLTSFWPAICLLLDTPHMWFWREDYYGLKDLPLKTDCYFSNLW
jgi:hypothetical protein